MKKNCAIILAAGRGKRMGANKNKMFLSLKEKPVLYYTLKAFSENPLIDSIILVAAENELDYCKTNIIDKYNIKKVSAIVKGGKERYNSVYNGLVNLKDCDIVLIHDGARPFINDRIICDGIKYAKLYGACSCGVNPKDTIKIRKSNGFSKETLNRKELFNVQTPQCFKYDIILKCHENIKKINEHNITDDTMIVEYFGNRVYLYDGDYTNIKITTPEDLTIGEKILDEI